MVENKLRHAHKVKTTENKQRRQDLYQSIVEYKEVAMCAPNMDMVYCYMVLRELIVVSHQSGRNMTTNKTSTTGGGVF